jgi:DNA polymerase-3 subunit delta
MLIKYQALSSSIQKKLHACYILIGNDPYLLNDAAIQIKQTFLRRGECSQTILDINQPTDWSSLIAEANSYSLFSEYVFLDGRFEKKTIDATGKELLQDYLSSVNERCMIVLRAPQLNSKSLQWLINIPEAMVVQISPLPPFALKQWIEKQLLSHNLKTEPAMIDLIHQYTQGNMLATAQFIEKLAIAYPPNTYITNTMLREQLSDQAHFEVYELSNACLNANALHSLRLLNQFKLERIEPTLVLWVLTQEIRQLIQLHYALKRSTSFESACTQLKIWSSKIRLYEKAHARLSLATLLQLLRKCAQLDEHIKTSQNMQIWEQFDNVALSLCGVYQ